MSYKGSCDQNMMWGRGMCVFNGALAVVELEPNFIESPDKNFFFSWLQFIFLYYICGHIQRFWAKQIVVTVWWLWYLGHTAIEADASLMVVQFSAHKISYNVIYSLNFINELIEINHRITFRFFHRIIDF